MKKIPPIAYYLVLGLVLAGYIYFFERGPVKNKAADQSNKNVSIFTNYVADDIDQITLENLSTTLTAFKSPIVLKEDDKDVWQITAPQKFRADQSTIRNLLSSASDFNVQTTIPNANLADFGLKTPMARCTFQSKSGAHFVLLVGDKNVTGASTYVKTPIQNDVYMVPAYSIDNLCKGVNDYRDKTFFQTDGVLAGRIRIVRKGKTTVFEKDKQGDWNILEPIKDKADDQRVKDLLNTINNLSIVGYENDNPTNLAIYGLSQPHTTLEVWSTDGKEKHVIELGRTKLKTTQCFAKSGDLPYVFLINNSFDNTLDIDLTGYRDKSMMQFNAAQAQTITVKHNGKTYVYQNTNNQWSCPGRANAETEGKYLVNNLSSTTITGFATRKDKTGLHYPSYWIEVKLNTGAQRIYRFGNIKEGLVYLASDKNKDVYQAPSYMMTTLDGYYNAMLTPVPITSPTTK